MTTSDTASKAARKSGKAARPGATFPASLDPVVVVPVKSLPPGRWRFEFKLDGYRMLARIDGGGASGRVTLFNRRGEDWTARLPQVATALKKIPRGTWLDGVVTADDAQHVTYHLFDTAFL